MTVFFIVLQSLLAFYYVFSGTAKTIGAKYWVGIFNNLGIPQWFRVVTGVVQLVGAALLIFGYWYSDAVTWACIWLGITMLLACLAHIRVKDPIGKTAPALMFTALIIILAIVSAAV
jgi:uncharacterized membrane protein YphA (DoxX/SURF4 family)